MSKASKVFIMGIDGMDPLITKKYMDEGIMPNLEKFLSRGACRENMAMIGGMPTVTPPMWTTLATGASPVVHSVHEFSKKGSQIGFPTYNFDSRDCLAEQIWNVTAEAGLKTLVWHWPGSSWPPSSNSENLWVIDGTQPEGVNCGNAVVEDEKILIADVKTPEVKFRAKAAADSNVPCFITGMEFEEDELDDALARMCSTEERKAKPKVVDANLSKVPMDVIYSPIKEATGWTVAPADAKECVIIHSKGLIHRPCLILKNDTGIYDTMEIYANKKAEDPIIRLKVGEYVKDVIDDAINKKDEKVSVNRNMRILEMSEDGNHIRMWISSAMDYHNDILWHPKFLLSDVVENVGYPQPCAVGGGEDEQLVSEVMAATWRSAGEWTANSIQYLMKAHNLDVVFSHFHNVDLQGHMLVKFLKHGSESLPAQRIQELFRDVYIQTDEYIGRYLNLLDEGWTIMIISDHGQTCPEKHYDSLLVGPDDIEANYMVDWGFTVLKTNDDGEQDVDWSKTKAVLWRMGEVWLNIKGRDNHDGVDGIVDPADQWELEEEIMTKLMETKSPMTGHRMITCAVRNKDAIAFGMGGPNCGDIVYFGAEGYTYDHADSLSTMYGHHDTSVMSYFAAAGPGIKENLKTPRIIRHVDVTPTIATLLGTRMPAQCEGAPIYQILE